MSFYSRLLTAGAVAIVTGLASAANATIYTLDTGSSSINLVSTIDLCIGCGLMADFSAEAQAPLVWNAAAPSDTLFVENFLDWTVGPGFGGELYDVSVSLAFSTPDAASGSTTGSAAIGTILGVISGGILTWDGPGVVSFADGSILTFLLESVAAGGFGNSASTGVTFQVDNVAPVPLPAAGLLLLAGLGGLAAMRRTRA